MPVAVADSDPLHILNTVTAASGGKGNTCDPRPVNPASGIKAPRPICGVVPCAKYLAHGTFDLPDYVERLYQWYKRGEKGVNGVCFDIDTAFRTAIERWLAEGLHRNDNLNPNTTGKGSITRLAPSAISGAVGYLILGIGAGLGL